MKITILGPAHPYRGGLATFIEQVAKQFTKDGHEVNIKTFTLQYPEFLFPGKTQISDSDAPKGLDIERCVNSVNPFNWIKIGLKLKKERPDLIVIKYWTPFMAPCLGTICRIARSNGHTKIISQLDNIEPHEKKITDKLLNIYGINSIDGFIYMSNEVKADLDKYSKKPSVFSPHPLFDNFGERVSKEAACEAIGLDNNQNYLLFFGLIRDYKGLDILLEACHILKQKGKITNKKIIVAGEFYTSKEKYLDLIKSYNLVEDIIMHDFFVANDNVKYYFSAADCVVQPYKTATQSGVTQIAYQFCTPMIVTNAGGLAEIVPHDKVGYVCDTNAEAVAEAIENIYINNNINIFAENMIEERKRFSWKEMCEKTLEIKYKCDF